MATLEAIQEKIKKLQAQADAIIAKKAQGAVDHIRKIMIEHGLTTEAIEAAAKSRRDARLGKVKIKAISAGVDAAAGKVQAKYRDAKSGATWSGRGRAPAWIANAKDRTKFLIASEVAAVASLKGGAVRAAKKTAAKTAAKKAVKQAVKQAAVKKAVAKKVTAKKPAVKKAAVKTPAVKKVAAKKAMTLAPASKKSTRKTIAAATE